MVLAFRGREGCKFVSEDVHPLVSESASSPRLWRQITWQLGNVPMHVREKKSEQNKCPPPGWQEVWSASSEHRGGEKHDQGSLAFTNEQARKLLI